MVSASRADSAKAVLAKAGGLPLMLGSGLDLTVFNSHLTPPRILDSAAGVVDRIGERYTWLHPQDLPSYIADPQSFTNGPYALLTFDDGFANNHGIAELLADRGVSAVFFVATGFVTSDDPLAFYTGNILRTARRLPGLEDEPDSEYDALTPTQVVQMQDMGHVIGSHTVNHRLVDQLDEAALDYELTASAETLGEWLGEKPQYFASPFDSRGLPRRVHEAVERVYDKHFLTLDLSNRKYADSMIFRTNMEFYWPAEKIDYAITMRRVERLRWQLSNRRFIQEFGLN